MTIEERIAEANDEIEKTEAEISELESRLVVTREHLAEWLDVRTEAEQEILGMEA
jgi:predicted  nucleic acid-binding Zn-ribbon protein